jgi:hypothetical protein
MLKSKFCLTFCCPKLTILRIIFLKLIALSALKTRRLARGSYGFYTILVWFCFALIWWAIVFVSVGMRPTVVYNILVLYCLYALAGARVRE